MKLTKETLKQIIKEELNSLLQETSTDGYYHNAAFELDDLHAIIGEESPDPIDKYIASKEEILDDSSILGRNFNRALENIKKAMALDGKSP